MFGKLLALGIGAVISWGGTDFIDSQLAKEEKNNIQAIQEDVNKEQKLQVENHKPLTNVYEEKEITEMLDNGKMANYITYNDGSILLMDKEKNKYAFLPKNDASRKVTSDNFNEIMDIVEGYIAYHGTRDEATPQELQADINK